MPRAKRGIVFGVTYNYTGYPMVRQAREMVRSGELGEVRKVVVEYNQGWLATQLEASGNKQAGWRTDPAQQRPGRGDRRHRLARREPASHRSPACEIESLCADLTRFVPGRRLDDDANLLLRFTSGARGVLVASQIETGVENDLRLRVFGTLGSIEWRQENPNQLAHLPIDGPKRILTRGSPWLCEAAKKATRLPPGHPEAFIEAFANVYLGVIEAIRQPGAGDYPTVHDGARGVRFIEKAVESARSAAKWTAW